MKIVIGHLFYDLLNLYGESGNVLALEKAFEKQNIDVEIKLLSLDNQPWNLEDIDMLYIGAGTENNQLLALDTLKNYKEDINQLIINNKLVLSTGNSIELFGKVINTDEGEIPALGIFDYTTQRTKNRIVSECVFNYDQIDDKILGFENHQGVISQIENPLFTIEKGFGSYPNSNTEGIRKNNFYGTYLIGPLLVRNPKLLTKLCKDVISTKDSNFEIKSFDFTIEEKAHNIFLSKYKKD